MSKSKHVFLAALIIFSAGLFSVAKSVQAYQISSPEGVLAFGDFVIGPSKVELAVEPGESTSTTLIILNRFGSDLNFTVQTEDFATSTKNAGEVDLLGDKSGMYSLKSFLKPEISSFRLRQGEQMRLPITIAIPKNAEPQGLYGAVMVAATPADSNPGSIQVTSRLASLFFVRVKGVAVENGMLQDFNSSRLLYSDPSFQFDFFYKNNGNVYLNPYGLLTVKALWGREICRKQIAPYFVLPGAVRQQQLSVDCPAYPGVYRADLKLNRGYGNSIDEKSVYLILLPWPYMIALTLALVIMLSLIVGRINKRKKYYTKL